MFAVTRIKAGTKFAVGNRAGNCSGITEEMRDTLFTDPGECQHLKEGLDERKLKELYVLYYENAKSRTNTRLLFYGRNMVAEATKDIEPDQELLRCYGFREWYRWWFATSLVEKDANQALLKQFAMRYEENDEVDHLMKVHYFLTK